jgi:uncharacterized protein involved in exopolysaccharide biosynthesis
MTQRTSHEPVVNSLPMNDVDDDFEDDTASSKDGAVELLLPIAQHWRSLLSVMIVAGALGTAYAFTLAPVFTARALFIPPQQQNNASAALASLGALAGAPSGFGSASKSTADEYVALMSSTTVRDRMIDKFNLRAVYEIPSRDKARVELSARSDFSVGKKDGLITVSVEDTNPDRAASMANQFIEELRRITSVLAVSEAQRRRMFFEQQLKETQDRLTNAQLALQGSGFTEGALKAEPRAAAEGYAKLQAEETSAIVELQTMRGSLAEGSAQIQQQLAKVKALREQIQAQEAPGAGASQSTADFVGKYREFKYQEALFDMMARQYELARVDESREGALIQVVDAAQPPEHKTRPARLVFGAITALCFGFAYAALLVARGRARAFVADPHGAQRWAAIRAAIRRH